MFGYEDELQDEIDKLKEQLHKWKAIAEILYEDLKYGFTNDEMQKDLKMYEELKQQEAPKTIQK